MSPSSMTPSARAEASKFARELERTINKRITEALDKREKHMGQTRGIARQVGPVTGPEGIAQTLNGLTGSQYQDIYGGGTFRIKRVLQFQVVREGQTDWVIALVESDQE